MRILNDDTVADFLKSKNPEPPAQSVNQLQVHLDYACGCKITVDKNSSLFPCESHKDWANENRDNVTLHKVLH